MHDHDPPDQPLGAPAERPSAGRRAKTAGSVLVGLGLLAAKFKSALLLLFSFKWIFLGSKLLLSFGSMFVSVLLYAALFGGWKIAIVFVLMILVHELGHYLTWRNFGVAVNLPMFIPGFGAFVSSHGGTPAQNLAAAIAGPLFGIAAAAACWAYGLQTGEHFWIACAYIGFFLNFFNLMPIPMLDGGAIAGALDARLWFLGVPLLLAYLFFFGVSPFGVIIVLLIGFNAVPRLIALWRGQIDPRAVQLTGFQRTVGGLAYLGLILLGIAGAAATNVAQRG